MSHQPQPEHKTPATIIESELAQQFANQILHQSTITFKRIYDSSPVLQTIFKNELHQECRSHGLQLQRASSQPSTPTAESSLLYICAALNKNHKKVVDSSNNNESITEKSIWSILSTEVNEFSVERAIECIKRFIRMWKFNEKWYIKVRYNSKCAASDSNRHHFNVIFSLIDLQLFQPFETCSVDFHFEPSLSRSNGNGNGYRITYQFEQMMTEYAVDGELYHFQESYLKFIINEKIKIQMQMRMNDTWSYCAVDSVENKRRVIIFSSCDFVQ